MNPIQKIQDSIASIEEKLGYAFKDRILLQSAFVHRSFFNEHRDLVPEHNERLEFLGDTVLGLLAAEYLYKRFPDAPEGNLSYLRSRLVEAQSCMMYVQSLDVENFVLLGRGERLNDGRGRESILADLFEAIIGAIFLDGGIESARVFMFDNFIEAIDEIVTTPEKNWKAILQDYVQKRYHVHPEYGVLDEKGPEHSKMFEVSVSSNGEEMGVGKGASKKEAQQAAAEDAVKKIQAQGKNLDHG